jgi:multidrug efflux pump subunit AcrA (membrane-fusion protein)
MKKKIAYPLSHQEPCMTSRGVLHSVLALGMAFIVIQGHAQSPVLPKGPLVKVIAVGQTAIASFSEMDGLIEAVMQSTLSSQLPGRIISLKVKAGRSESTRLNSSHLKLSRMPSSA